MLRLIFNPLTGGFLSVLAGDLLYLYYSGVWHDPIKLIEITEVVLLYILCAWGVVWMIMTIKMKGQLCPKSKREEVNMAIKWSALKVSEAMDEAEGFIKEVETPLGLAKLVVTEARKIPNLPQYMGESGDRNELRQR